MRLEEIDRILSRGDRNAVEGLFSQIIHFTDVAECTVKLCVTRLNRDAGDHEFHGRELYEAALKLGQWCVSSLPRQLSPSEIFRVHRKRLREIIERHGGKNPRAAWDLDHEGWEGDFGHLHIAFTHESEPTAWGFSAGPIAKEVEALLGERDLSTVLLYNNVNAKAPFGEDEGHPL